MFAARLLFDRANRPQHTPRGRRRRRPGRDNLTAEAVFRRQRECRIDVDTNHVSTRREPNLTLTGEQHFPGLVLLAADQGVLAVGAEPPVGSELASGAGQAVVAAGSAVLGPSARLEVPATEGPDNDMDASR
jgi:hypothetical protein